MATSDTARARRPRAEYRCRWLMLTSLCLLLSGVGALPILDALRPGRFSPLALGLGLALTLLFWGLAALTYRRDGGRRLLLLEHGLLERRRGREQLYRWDEIEQFASYAVVYGAALLVLSLRCRDGRRLSVGGDLGRPALPWRGWGVPPWIGLLDLSAAVQHASYPHRLAAAAARLDAGEPVALGKLALSRAGLAVGEALLPWDQVAGLSRAEDALVLLAAGRSRPWRVLAWADAPNSDLLPALLERAGGPPLDTRPAAGWLTEQARRARAARQRPLRWAALLLSLALALGLPYGRYWLSPRRHVDRGLAHLASSQDSAALAEFEAALAQDPAEPDALLGRAQAHQRLGHLEPALADYNAALQARPDDPLALVLRGRLFSDQGRHQQALEAYAQALALRPHYPYAYCGRGYTYQRLGQTKPALRDYTSCRQLATERAWREEAQRMIWRLGGQ